VKGGGNQLSIRRFRGESSKVFEKAFDFQYGGEGKGGGDEIEHRRGESNREEGE